MNYNKVIVIGGLIKDPELKTSPTTGSTKCEFTLIWSDEYTTKDGKEKKEVAFFNCECWGPSAETLHKHAKKGSQLLVEGKMITHSYTNRSGEKKSYTALGVRDWQFAGPRPQQNQATESPASGDTVDIPF